MAKVDNRLVRESVGMKEEESRKVLFICNVLGIEYMYIYLLHVVPKSCQLPCKQAHE